MKMDGIIINNTNICNGCSCGPTSQCFLDCHELSNRAYFTVVCDCGSKYCYARDSKSPVQCQSCGQAHS